MQNISCPQMPLFSLLLLPLLLLISVSVTAFRPLSHHNSNHHYTTTITTTKHMMSASYTIADISKLSLKEVLGAICGTQDINQDSNNKKTGVKFLKENPGPTKYVIANPKAFFENKKIASLYGFNPDELGITPETKLDTLAYFLPVIYIADVHPEYGTVGYMLTKESTKTKMAEKYAGLKKFRDRPVYIGGTQSRGSSFTMLHQKSGFPENREWKRLADDSSSTKKTPPLFFSPDVAMANELCSTNDALPTEFKFFEWATVWSVGQLKYECDKNEMWLTVSAPIDTLFSDQKRSRPIWKQLVEAAPEGTATFPEPQPAGSFSLPGSVSSGSGSDSPNNAEVEVGAGAEVGYDNSGFDGAVAKEVEEEFDFDIP